MDVQFLNGGGKDKMTEAQEWAKKRNFELFRLTGVLETLRSVRNSTDDVLLKSHLWRAMMSTRAALNKIKNVNTYKAYLYLKEKA